MRIWLGESLLEQHLNQNPSDKTIRRQLIDSYTRLGPPEKAIEHLKVLAVEPEFEEDSLRLLAALAIKSSNIALAEESLMQLRKLQPGDFAANLALAELYFNSGRPVDAIPLIEASIKTDPKRSASYLLLADALGEAGRNQEMITPLEACLELTPDEFAAHANLAFAYYTAGRSDEAIFQAQWCLARSPNFNKVRLILAHAQRDKGEHAASLATVVRAEPENLDTILLQADLVFFGGDGRDVFDRLVPFYEKHRDSRKLISHLMRAAVAKGDREQAKHWQKILSDLIPEKE
jgi:tetratricopeptide (TPR) repeat protein